MSVIGPVTRIHLESLEKDNYDTVQEENVQ